MNTWSPRSRSSRAIQLPMHPYPPVNSTRIVNHPSEEGTRPPIIYIRPARPGPRSFGEGDIFQVKRHQKGDGFLPVEDQLGGLALGPVDQVVDELVGIDVEGGLGN